MKNKLRVFLLALLACLLMAGGAMAAEFGVIHRTESLNLRSQGSSSSQWLGSYPQGTWVEITGSQNNFYRVKTPDGRTGYMSKNYIRLAPSSEDRSWTVYVTNQNGGAFLNFRSQPNYNCQVLGIFYNGVPLHALGLNNGWYQVEINGQVGYVRSEYVTDWGYQTMGSGTVATIKTPGNTAMNLRNGPGMTYGLVAQFPGDSYVSVLAKGNGWWCVGIDGYTGFMSSDYLVEGLCAARDEAAYPTETAYAVVNNPGAHQALNLRLQPSTGAAVLDKLYNGTRLWVDEQGSEWCAVTDQTTGLSGYVMTRYIKLYGTSASSAKRVHHPSGSYVNLRSSPNMSPNTVLVRVPSGQSVIVLSPGSEWSKVQYNGYNGYMLTYFLQ